MGAYRMPPVIFNPLKTGKGTLTEGRVGSGVDHASRGPHVDRFWTIKPHEIRGQMAEGEGFEPPARKAPAR